MASLQDRVQHHIAQLDKEVCVFCFLLLTALLMSWFLLSLLELLGVKEGKE
jgi:hypothetical protein